MAFFLIGRGPNEELEFLSASIFESRQEAMSELSRLSADPSFTQWDADVFVMNLEDGVPVLLVRPQEAGLAAESASPMSEGSTELPEEPAGEPLLVAEPSAVEAPEETPAAESTATAAQGTATAEEAPAEEAAAEEVQPEELRDALLRTAEHMTSQGVVAPESAGLEGAAGVSAMPVSEPSDAEVPEIGLDAPEEPALEVPAQEAPVEPEAVPIAEPASAEWPWNAQVGASEEPANMTSPDIAGVYEALEEPQEAPIIPEESAPGEAEEADDEVDSDFILDLDAIQPVSLEDSESTAGETAEAATSGASAEPTAQDAAPSGEDYASPLTDYTCADCVYVETCPNRDQRAPKDCGSFQWK